VLSPAPARRPRHAGISPGSSPLIRSAARSPGFAPGAMRSFSGDYPLAFMTSGLACLSASLLALQIRRLAPAIVPTGLDRKRTRDLTHRATLAVAGARCLPVDLGHHFAHIDAFGDAMAVAANRCARPQGSGVNSLRRMALSSLRGHDQADCRSFAQPASSSSRAQGRRVAISRR